MGTGEKTRVLRAKGASCVRKLPPEGTESLWRHCVFLRFHYNSLNKPVGGERMRVQPWLEESGLTLIRGWARAGVSPRTIAGRMGVGLRTLERWRRRGWCEYYLLQQQRQRRFNVLSRWCCRTWARITYSSN